MSLVLAPDTIVEVDIPLVSSVIVEVPTSIVVIEPPTVSVTSVILLFL